MEAVKEARRRLRILFEGERELVRTLSTWVYRVGEPEKKYMLSEHIWEAAQHGRFLKERGEELGSFGRGDEAREGLKRVFETGVRAVEESEGTGIFYGVLKPMLRAGYREYLEVCEPVADWPTRQLVEGFLEDSERQEAEWSEAFGLPEITPAVRELENWIRESGGLFGVAERALEEYPERLRTEPGSYRHPDACNRGRFPTCASAFGEDPSGDTVVGSWIEDPLTDARIIRVMIYIWLMNEMDAVDYLATIFYDTPGMPQSFHYDAARHLWDESRHSQFGYRQLPRMGYDLSRIEQQVELYEILVRMDPAERYAMMTMQFEAGSFGIKATVMERVRELNDFEADTLLAFDRNDEQNHVRYGHRWLQPLLEYTGHEGGIEEFLKVTSEKFGRIREEISPRLEHGLPVSERLTAEKIRERILR